MPSYLMAGWGEALQLMRPGDKWALILPAELGYGDKEVRGVPGGSTLLLNLELLEVKPPGLLTFNGVDYSKYMPMVLMVVVQIAMAFMKSDPNEKKKGGKLEAAAASKRDDHPVVYLDVAIGGAAARRIELELFATQFPKTADNFRCLCTGEKASADGTKLHYKGAPFHRVIPGFVCQGGDISNGDGTGGESIYGKTFEDEFEHAVVGHSEPFLLSMANAGPHTNGSQFFITTAAAPKLDAKHVVFGKVVGGSEVVKAIEAVGSGSGATYEPVVIAACGELASKPKQS